MSIYTVHGGHAAHGNKYCGAVGYCSESLVDRAITKAVIKYFKLAGHTAVDCSVDTGISQSNIIKKIKKKINAVPGAKANISIHLNASKKTKADGKNKGCEVLIYSTKTDAEVYAIKVGLNLKKLGFTNRGVKVRQDLGVLKGITNGGANILVECFFCDDEDDYILFNKVGADAIGKAIAEGVLGYSISIDVPTNTSGKYIYNDKLMGKVDLAAVFDVNYYASHHKDVVKALGNNQNVLFEHFKTYGMREGRQANAEFNPAVYRERYIDLQQAYGTNLIYYYLHYCLFGKKEGRKAT